MAKSTQRFVMDPVQPFSFDILPAEIPLWTDIDGMNSSRQVELWWQIAFRVETTGGGNVRYGSIAVCRDRPIAAVLLCAHEIMMDQVGSKLLVRPNATIGQIGAILIQSLSSAYAFQSLADKPRWNTDTAESI